MGFSRQEYVSGLPFTPPGHPPEPGIQIESPTWEAPDVLIFAQLVLNVPSNQPSSKLLLICQCPCIPE